MNMCTHRVYEMLCNPAICTCFPHTDYIMQTVVSTIYMCRVPVMSMKTCDMYLFSLTYRLHIEKQPEGLYTCADTWNVYITLWYVPVSHTEYITLNSQDGYIYVYVPIIRNVNETLRYVPVLHTDYIIKNSQKGLYICAGYMKITLCNPAICTCFYIQTTKCESGNWRKIKE